MIDHILDIKKSIETLNNKFNELCWLFEEMKNAEKIQDEMAQASKMLEMGKKAHICENCALIVKNKFDDIWQQIFLTHSNLERKLHNGKES